MPAKVQVILEAQADAATKEVEKFGDSIQGLSDDFKALNPEITKGAETWAGVAENAKKAKPALEQASKAQKEATASGFGLTKQLGRMAKGLVGIASAYAAGRWLVNFTKDALKAADAAGKLPPAYKRSEASTRQLKETVGEYIGQEGVGLLTFLEKEKQSIIEVYEARIKLNKAEKDGAIIAKGDYTPALMGLAEQGYGSVIERAAEYDHQLNENKLAMQAAIVTVEKAAVMNRWYADVIKEAEAPTWQLRDAVDGVTGSMDLEAALAAEVTLQMREMTESTLEYHQLQLDLAIATGNLTEEERLQAEQQIINLANIVALGEQKTKNLITDQQWIDIMADGIVTQQELQTGIGTTITKYGELSGSLGDVTLPAIDWKTELQRIQDETKNLMDKNPAFLETLGQDEETLEAVADAGQSAASHIRGVERAGESIDGKEFEVTFTTHYRETYGGGGGGKPKDPRKGSGNIGPWGGQRGLDMIVPPGFPADSFPVRATSGERVTVQTKAQQHGGGDFAARLENLEFAIEGMGDKIISAIAMLT
jgi:uncharacterized protein YoxC